MLQLLARRWWALALRGAIAVLFGLLTFFIPGVTLISLVLLFGFYAILDGIFDIVSAMKAPGHHWPEQLQEIVLEEAHSRLLDKLTDEVGRHSSPTQKNWERAIGRRSQV